MTISQFFIGCAFAYTICIILIAAILPPVWGVQGLIPIGIGAPLAIPAFGFLLLAMVLES